MKLLITKYDVQKHVQITNKRNDNIIEQYIKDAQFIDLQNLLCEQFYSELVRNPEDFAELLKGSTYQYNGITYINQGLEAVLSYFTYARYMFNGSNIDTPYGNVEKTDPNSHQNSDKTKQRIYTYNRQNAITYWNNVKKFLKRKNFNGYNDKCKCVEGKINNTIKLNVIG